jgi:RNA-directed DNA polymerase
MHRSNLPELDADIRGFLDAIDHEWMVKVDKHRVGNARVVRLIQEWLTAGVMESRGMGAQ